MLASGCGDALPTTPVYLGGGSPLQTEGIAQCTREQPDSIRIDPTRPVVVLVHGCFSSGSRFKKLSDVFTLHDQQVLCFNYDDRDSLRAVALRLQTFLYELQRRLDDQTVTVVGHSQGGMISRIALSDWATPPANARFSLVTVSSPLSGIDAAEHCGWTGLHVATLGITVGVCAAIAGSPWTEIHPGSRIWTDPLQLYPQVSEHLVIITNEKGTCRVRAEDGSCQEDDFVFTSSEQLNPKIVEDARVRVVTARAGHAEIVGESDVEPRKLIEILQRSNILRPTPKDKEAALTALLRGWF